MMFPKQLVLDTDVVIQLLKNHPQTVARFISLMEAQTDFLLSPIVVAEIYAGAFEREYKEIELLFGLCKRIPIDSNTGRQTGLYASRYRKAYQGISLNSNMRWKPYHTNYCGSCKKSRKPNLLTTSAQPNANLKRQYASGHLYKFVTPAKAGVQLIKQAVQRTDRTAF